jgi:hypothetical protein
MGARARIRRETRSEPAGDGCADLIRARPASISGTTTSGFDERRGLVSVFAVSNR